MSVVAKLSPISATAEHFLVCSLVTTAALLRCRHATTYTAYVTVCDPEKSLSFHTTLKYDLPRNEPCYIAGMFFL